MLCLIFPVFDLLRIQLAVLAATAVVSDIRNRDFVFERIEIYFCQEEPGEYQLLCLLASNRKLQYIHAIDGI